jgi:hypothetical protein
MGESAESPPMGFVGAGRDGRVSNLECRDHLILVGHRHFLLGIAMVVPGI